jgi:hypothetical protein
MTTISIRKIMLILSIATGTLLAPASQAIEPKINCVLGNWDSANGLSTECEPRDDSCSKAGVYYRDLTETDCRAKGGRPLYEFYM